MRRAANVHHEELSLLWDDVECDAYLDADGIIGTADLLSLRKVSAGYGRHIVVRDITLRVAAGEIVALLGHNGSGKSTTLRAAFGLTPPSSGQVVFSGVDVTTASPRLRRDLGAAFVPAVGEVFADLTVEQNLRLAAGPKLPRDVVISRIDGVLAAFPGLRRSMRLESGALSGGEQRMVGLGIALMTEPRLLLLDEPSKHLAPSTADDILSIVAEQAETRSIGVLIAEVNVGAALRVAGRVYAMRSGEIAAERRACDLLAAGPTSWWTLT